METKPSYQVRVQIIDTASDETVVSIHAGIPNEKRVNPPLLGMEDLNEDDAEACFWDAMKHFRNYKQERYEAENYPCSVHGAAHEFADVEGERKCACGAEETTD